MKKFTFLVSLFALLIAGCSGSRPPRSDLPQRGVSSDGSALQGAALAGPTWRLVAFGEAARPVPVLEGTEITAAFSEDEGRLTGTAGCNRYFGAYQVGGRRLTLSQIGATRRACRPRVMEQEQVYLLALDVTRRWEREGDTLTLMNAEGRRLLRFAAEQEGAEQEGAGQASLTGEVFYRPRIALPPDAVVTVRLLDVSRADAPAQTLAAAAIPTEGRQVPLPFELRYDPGRLDPRNRYAVRAQIRDDAGTLLWTTDTVHPVLTQGAPSDRVDVEVVQVPSTGDSGEAGALTGPAWRLVQIETPSGGATRPEGGDAYTISFGADGRYNGQADCNRYGGAYEARPEPDSAQAQGALELRRGLSTLAACAPPSSSEAFFGVLNAVERYAVADARLRLEAGEGRALVFERADNAGDAGDAGNAGDAGDAGSVGTIGDSAAQPAPKRVGLAVQEALLTNFVINRYDAWVADEDWARVDLEDWSRNLRLGWEWDENKFTSNMIMHPIHGSFYFNAGRSNGLSYWESVPLVFLGSFTWEHFGEKYRPALNDFFMTSFGGIALGEMMHRVSATIRDERARGAGRIGREIAALAVNPMEGLNRLLRGQWTRVGPNPSEHAPEALFFEFGAGVRNVFEESEGGSNVAPLLLLDIGYGDAFETSYRAPYDVFSVHAQISSGQGGLNALQTSGRLYQTALPWWEDHYALAVHHRYDYLNNPAYRFGAQSVDAGLAARFSLPGGLTLRTRVAGSGLVMGGVSAPESGVGDRTYDFGPGVGAVLSAALVHESGAYLSLYNRAAYLHSVSGAPADHVVAFSGLWGALPLYRGFGLGFYLSGDARASRYPDRPEINQQFIETRVFLSWTSFRQPTVQGTR